VQAVGVPGQQRCGGGGCGRAACEAGEQREERGPDVWAVMGWLAWPARNEQWRFAIIQKMFKLFEMI
jgi:hypothetical protein